MPKISIQIVTWNSLQFLPDCLESVFKQTFKDFSVLVIDNASTDGTIEYLEREWAKIKILKNSRNFGFARAHNQGILATQGEYVLVMNPDVVWEPDFLKKLVTVADQNQTAGSLGGKLLKIQSGDIEIAEKIKTAVIDSAGLRIFKSRRVVDRGEREEDKGQYEEQSEVFGFSGACVLYRRAALEDIKIPTPKIRMCPNDPNNSGGRFRVAEARGGGALFGCEYFDEDFFAYKEDVDLAWRLRLRGWSAIYIPKAKAYHFRGASALERLKHSPMVNFYSFRNHLWLLLKNDAWQSFLRYLWFIFWYQLSKEIYLCFTQPLVLAKASLSFWQGFGKMYAKRKYIFKNAKTKPAEIKTWFQ